MAIVLLHLQEECRNVGYTNRPKRLSSTFAVTDSALLAMVTDSLSAFAGFEDILNMHHFVNVLFKWVCHILLFIDRRVYAVC